MPEESYWETFFDADATIRKLFGDNAIQGNVVEFGCGYGTFTLPAARHTTGTVLALDIESGLIESLRHKAKTEPLSNIKAEVRDFVVHGARLAEGTQTHAMIYNLLHLENPVELLKEAHRVLQAGGRLSVIHWRSDISTPRGPSLDIRPTPEQCRKWIREAGFRDIHDVNLKECCPFHFGIISVK